MASGINWRESNDLVTLTICRTHARNAIDGPAMIDLEKAVERLHQHAALRGVILTSHGGRAFCAGGDLKWLQSLTTASDGAAMSRRMHRVVKGLDELPQPVVIVVNGYAFGGGAELALAGDITIMEEHSFLCFKQAQMGLITGWGGAARLVRRIGYSRAYELLATGERLQSVKALNIGLVNRVVPEGTGMQHALEFFDKADAASPRALSVIKQLFQAAQSQRCHDTDELEAKMFETVWTSSEHDAAVQAFMATRQPKRPK